MLDRSLMSEALPGYEIGDEIGRGAFGVVVVARHLALDRKVAIKQLVRPGEPNRIMQQRFEAEAQTIARLDNPHIVKVYDFVVRDGAQFIVMEHLGGGTLWQRFSGAGVATDHACAITMAVCAGLQAAHVARVLHRDIKPENIFFGEHGLVKVGDFGIAKVLGFGGNLTAAGEALGTPAYMSPEQVLGETLTAASDVYSLGVVLYELLAGRPPFEGGEHPISLLYKHAAEPPQPLPPDVPPQLREVVEQALQKRPEDRFPSAEIFGARIGQAAAELFGDRWIRYTGYQIADTGAISDVLHHNFASPLRTVPTTRTASVRHVRLGTVAPARPEPDEVPAPGVPAGAAPPHVVPQPVPPPAWSDVAPSFEDDPDEAPVWPWIVGITLAAVVAIALLFAFLG